MEASAYQDDVQRADGNGAAGSSGSRASGQDRSLSVLVKELLQESQALARAEVALVKSEINEKVSEAQQGTVSMMVGGATLAAGLLVLLAAAVLALGTVVEMWFSALLVGGAVSVVGVAMVAAGRQRTRADNLMPERSIEEAKRTRQFTQEQVR